ncbi:MAG: hypothetical protein E7562_04730 [Ruminococcaceae bacterium]|nr:hypothetical protein [Oscillospiraceae bacterium]
MAKKKKVNPIIAEQRRAREEFLKLKKMQSGEIPTEPKPSEVAVKPKTLGEKLKNIWYHDKYFIIGGLLTCIIIIIMVAQCVKKVDPDLQIVVFTYDTVSDASCEKISEFAQKHCEDINGDGKVKVQIVNCSFSNELGDLQYRNTLLQKMQGIIVAEENALLFITDDESIKYFSAADSALNGVFDTEPLPLNEAFYEACKIKSDNPLDFELKEGLSISCRKLEGTLLEGKDNSGKYIKNSNAILKAATE